MRVLPTWQELMISRLDLVGTTAASLKSLAQSCRVPVLVTNLGAWHGGLCQRFWFGRG